MEKNARSRKTASKTPTEVGQGPQSPQGQQQGKAQALKEEASHMRTGENLRDTEVSGGGERPETEGQTRRDSSGCTQKGAQRASRGH